MQTPVALRSAMPVVRNCRISAVPAASYCDETNSRSNAGQPHDNNSSLERSDSYRNFSRDPIPAMVRLPETFYTA